LNLRRTVSAVALRDRILLPNFTPVLANPIWQGRLALFGFLDDPDNPGAKFITRKPLNSGDFVKTVDSVDIGDAVEILSGSIFTDTGALNSNAEAFFWDAGKLLAERDIINFPRNLITVDSTVFESFSDSLIYTTALIPFNTDLDPEVFGISDTDVDPGGVGSILAICTDVCSEDPFVGVCADSTDPDCLACVKEDCLRDKIVDFMSGRTGLLPVVDNFGEPTTATCSSDIENNITEGIIGCGCPDIEEPSILHITDATVVASLRQQMIQCERRLGDIFHSGPKVVQAPSLLFFDVGFVNFASKFKERDAVIYVGANDGFLHAFDGGKLIDVSDTGLSDEEKTNPFTNLIQEDLPFIDEGTGEEVFAFAPPNFLQDAIAPDGTDLQNPIDFDPSSPGEFMDPALVSSGPEPVPDFRFGDFKTLVTKALDPFTFSFQRSFFDGTPLVADVFLDGDRDQTNGIQDGFNLCSSDPGDSPDGQIDPCGKEWHTVLMSGFRNGGGGLTALDVTNFDFDNKADSNSDGITDFTNLSDGPLYPQHLWTFFDRNMGNTWSQPKIGRVRVQYSGTPGVFDRWLIFVGGGFDPVFTDPVGDDDGDSTINAEEDSYRGSAFYAIDIATGKIVFKFDKNDDPNFICDVPADPNVLDINTDGFVDLVYIGDKCGRLWRFDVSEPIDAGVSASDAGIGSSLPSFSASGWSGLQVFCANDDTSCVDGLLGIPRKPQSGDTLYPIFFAPTSVIDNIGRRHVIFMTGDRAWPSNTSKTKIGKLYNFIDEYIPSFIRGSVLAIETFKTENDIDGSGTDGATILLEGSGVDQFTASNISALDPEEPAPGEFVVQFPNGNPSAGLNEESGEKGIGTPAVINGVMVFTTFKPDSGDIDICTAGLGSGRIFALDYITGASALFRIPGAQATIGSDHSIAGIKGGEGMPTPAQLSYSSKGTITMSLAFSGSGVTGGAQFLIWELPKLPASTQTLYWQEII